MKKPYKYWGDLTIILLLMVLLTGCKKINNGISVNKKTITNYMDGFNAGDHAKILSCITDDVIWEMPGVYRHTGKAAFDKEIENEAFVGRPVIKIIRMVEESDIVVAEGTVQGKRKDGKPFNAVFCDVFHMSQGQINQLTSYLMFKNP
jgi:ketosteroid isomerase-like protein